MEETFLFLREHDLVNRESFTRAAGEATDRFNELNTKIKNAEKRLSEIQILKKHMENYRKTKDVITLISEAFSVITSFSRVIFDYLVKAGIHDVPSLSLRR